MSIFAAIAAEKSTILVTGGGSGIGLALASRLLARGHEVIIAGRRAEVLEEAKSKYPGLKSIQGDVSTEEDREKLVESVLSAFPEVNILINNAGIQNRLPPLTDPSHGKELWKRHKQEIAINFEGPMHLSMLFLPHLLSRPQSRIINVTSGLAFVPIAFMPTYCATKAAMHSFTMSLRRQLQGTSVGVIEVAPPAVNTDLGGAGLHTYGENLDEFSDHILAKLDESDENVEVGFKMSEKMRNASREEVNAAFEMMNSRAH